MTIRELISLPFELINSGFNAIGIIFNAILDLNLFEAGLFIALLILIFLMYKALYQFAEYRNQILTKIPNPYKLILSFLFNNLFLWLGGFVIIMFVVIFFEMKILPYI